MRPHFRTRFAALALTLTTLTSAAPVGAAGGFSDVEADRWFTTPISWMAAEGITTGTEPGCFSPHAAVSRGQIVTFLYRLADTEGDLPVTNGHPFDDVVRAYQHEPVGWAYEAGITTGTSATTFAPDVDVTRGDFAVLLWRYAGEPQPSTDHPFTDVYRGYQQAAVSWMAENDITTGTSPTTFSAEDSMTRAEAATFLYRFVTPTDVAPEAPVESDHCLQWYRDFLVDLGLTADEAACAAPHVADLGRVYLAGVAHDTGTIGDPLYEAIADVIRAGCVPPDRYATVISILW